MQTWSNPMCWALDMGDSEIWPSRMTSSFVIKLDKDDESYMYLQLVMTHGITCSC